MTTPLHDEAHALPSEEAIAVGAAIQQIVAFESGAADSIDPLAGSYRVELMTKRIEEAVFAEIEKIDAMGGALAAIKSGYFQRELAREQFERNRAIEQGERKLVGVNLGARADEKRGIEIFRLDSGSERRQIEQLARVKAQRDAGKLTALSSSVREAAERPEPGSSILEAVKLYATQARSATCLREAFGNLPPGLADHGRLVSAGGDRRDARCCSQARTRQTIRSGSP